MKSPFLLLFLCWSLCYGPPVRGQSPPVSGSGSGPEFYFETFQLPGGLNSNHVQAITQDSLGFMWFGSQAGLHRWDGYEIRTYLHDRADPASLASDYVEYLYVDRSGALWVGTYGSGVDRFDYATETFEHLSYMPAGQAVNNSDFVTGIAEDRDGRLWIATHGGLYRHNPRSGHSRHYRADPHRSNSLSYDMCRVVYVDRAGTLWVGTGWPWEAGTEGGLNRYRPETDDFERYFHRPSDPTSLAHNKVMSIMEDSRQQLWVGTLGDGLHRMDRKTGRFERVGGKLAEPYVGAAKNRYVSTVFEDQVGRLWIGAWEGGIKYYDPQTGDSRTYYHTGNDQLGLPEPYPWTIFQSRDGTLWALTAGPGARVLKIREAVTRLHPVPAAQTQLVALSAAASGGLWTLSVTGALRYFDPELGEFATAAGHPDRDREVASPAWQIVEDGETIWERHPKGEGLLRYDPHTGESHRYRHDPNDGRSLGSGRVTDIYHDPSGRLWCVTSHGILNLYQPESDGFHRYPIPERAPGDPVPNHAPLLTGDDHGGLWLVLPGSARHNRPTAIGRFFPATQTLQFLPEQHLLPKYFAGDESIREIRSDGEGNLYLRSDRHLVLLGPGGEKRLVLNAKQFGASGFYGMVPDADGRLWLFAEELIRFDSRTEEYVIVPTPYAENDWRQNRLPLHRDRDGRIYCGVREGLLEIDPTKLDGVVAARPVGSMISDFALLDPVNGIALEGTTSPTTLGNRKIYLTHDENAFSFRYGNLNFQDPLAGRQEFKLEGYDGVWRPAGTEGMASYLGVPPGEYTFRVRSANLSGQWGPVASVGVRVLPPWWATWWAYLGYALLAGGLLGLLYRFQLHSRMDKAEARRLQELDAVKTRLYTNITHEFRTPLTVIAGMVTQIGEDPERWLPEGLAMIERSNSRLLGLVNQLLELSKLENGSSQLHERRGEIVAYLRYLGESMHALAATGEVGVHFHAEDPEVEMDYDPEKVQRIVINLLSNAIKFTPAGGHVYITVRRIAAGGSQTNFPTLPTLALSVRDTGVGISEARLPYIFDRFYQVDDSAARPGEGSGIGLALVRELVRLMDGHVAVRSTPGEGTEFTVQLPIRCVAEPAAVAPTALPVASAHAEDTAPAVPAHPPVVPPALSGGKPRVLIIEDNPDVVAYLAACLGDDYDLLIGRDGREGIDLALERIPDLVVTDVMMPHRDGYAVCRTLKADERTSHVPIIVLTAKADTESRLTGLETGADAYLAKPFVKRELLVRVDRLIEGRARLRQYYLTVAGMPAATPADPTDDPVTDPGGERSEHQFVIKLRNTVEEHLNDYAFDVNAFCRAAGMSSSQLHRKLTALTGLSPNRFIRFVRLSRAKSLLEDPGINVKVVAYDTGFSDPSYFSRAFKKEFGMTPLEWRGRIHA